MKKVELSEVDIHLLNSSAGYRNLLKPKTLDIARALNRVKYEISSEGITGGNDQIAAVGLCQ